jgi:hypothetical protein
MLVVGAAMLQRLEKKEQDILLNHLQTLDELISGFKLK